MSQTADRIGDYVRPEESLRVTCPATLFDAGGRTPVAVGVTDRRLLCLDDDGGFLAVGYGAVAAVQGRTRTTLSVRGNDYRLVVGAGALVALVGVLGILALAASWPVAALALAAVGGAVATEAARRSGDVREIVSLEPVERRATTDFDAVAVLRRWERRVADHADPHRLVLAGLGLATALSFVGAFALASSVLVPLLAASTLAGLALADRTYRRRGTFDGVELVRRHEREVEVRTEDGRSLSLSTDPAAGVDRTLTRLAFVERARADDRTARARGPRSRTPSS